MKHSIFVADEDQTPLAKLLELVTYKQYLDKIFDEIFVSAIGDDETMNRNAWVLLGALMSDANANSSRNQRHYVEKLDLCKVTMTRAVARLVELGYVSKETPKEDLRSTTLKLTDRGEAFFRETNERVSEALSRKLEGKRKALVLSHQLFTASLEREFGDGPENAL